LPGWKDVEDSVKERGTVYDIVRREHLAALQKHTKRNVIVYYSGWLQKQGVGLSVDSFSITDADKSGFMAVIHGLDRSKGLDLFLHTPGGDTAATESLGDYLRAMFKGDIRVIVPQLALSAGTMLACISREIVMGQHSSLGPIDPQLGGMAAQGVVEEFNQAMAEVKADPRSAAIWQVIISKYQPTLLGTCKQVITWSETMVRDWLKAGQMFNGKSDAEINTIADQIAKDLGDRKAMKVHNRHINAGKAKDLGLKIAMLEDDKDLQELVLTVHHCCIQTLGATTAYKIIENHKGKAVISDWSPVKI